MSFIEISLQISIGPLLPEGLHVLEIPIQKATQLTIALSGNEKIVCYSNKHVSIYIVKFKYVATDFWKRSSQKVEQFPSLTFVARVLSH